MKIGLIGLGKMGQAIAYRLLKNNFQVLGFDPNINKQKILNEIFEDEKNLLENKKNNFLLTKNLKELTEKTSIIWLMVPAGKITDDVINEILPNLKENSIVIDGGNSNFKNTIQRYKKLKEKNINFLDCGTSGGIAGKQQGFSIMIGGEKDVFEKIREIFKILAAPNGFGYMGPSGSGHYVKMIHNGIEYSLLQSYAEGFNLLKNNNNYKNLDLEKITNVWQNGSVIKSWILSLSKNIFSQDQNLDKISGKIGENLTGRWTLDEAKQQNIKMDLLEKSLQIRKWSRETGGNYATKVVAMLRNQFGGHKVLKG